MLQVFLGFLDKPRKPMERCDSERPISILKVLSKARKAVVLHRLMAQLEKSLADCQYGYRDERGAEHRLLELADFVREMRASQRFVDIASVDVVGAFATVPRKKLMEVGGALGVDSFSCRYLSGWLAGRVFVYPSAPLSVSPQTAVGISPSGAPACLPKWLSVYPQARVCPLPAVGSTVHGDASQEDSRKAESCVQFCGSSTLTR